MKSFCFGMGERTQGKGVSLQASRTIDSGYGAHGDAQPIYSRMRRPVQCRKCIGNCLPLCTFSALSENRLKLIFTKKALPSCCVFHKRGTMGEPRTAKSACRWKCPDEWAEWSEWLAAGLHARNRWPLGVLLAGILFTHRRRTVTSWLRAAGVSHNFRDYYYLLVPMGVKTKSAATRLLTLLLAKLPLPEHLLCDRSATPWDDPTRRRPSHADRRKALRQTILRNELSTLARAWHLPRKIIALAEGLMLLAG